MIPRIPQKKFMAMLGRCEGLIYRVCQIYAAHSHESIEDLYQEIVCNLWDGYQRFRNESTESTWVWQVAVNTAVSIARHEQHMPQMVEIPEDFYDTLADEQPNELLERLYELIDLLDEDERQLMSLYLSDATTAEMATALSCPQRTVERRINRLKQRLRELNEKEI